MLYVLNWRPLKFRDENSAEEWIEESEMGIQSTNWSTESLFEKRHWFFAPWKQLETDLAAWRKEIRHVEVGFDSAFLHVHLQNFEIYTEQPLFFEGQNMISAPVNRWLRDAIASFKGTEKIIILMSPLQEVPIELDSFWEWFYSFQHRALYRFEWEPQHFLICRGAYIFYSKSEKLESFPEVMKSRHSMKEREWWLVKQLRALWSKLKLHLGDIPNGKTYRRSQV